jgi:hypothetical protein
LKQVKGFVRKTFLNEVRRVFLMSRSGNGKNPCPLGEALKVDDPLAPQLKPGDYGTDEAKRNDRRIL